MNLHTHGHDDCALTSEVTIGDSGGGEVFTTGYLGGGEVKASALAHWGERLVWGCVVHARADVLLNAYHSHGPKRWRGERCAIVCYTSASLARLTPAPRQGVLGMRFHCGDDM